MGSALPLWCAWCSLKPNNTLQYCKAHARAQPRATIVSWCYTSPLSVYRASWKLDTFMQNSLSTNYKHCRTATACALPSLLTRDLHSKPSDMRSVQVGTVAQPPAACRPQHHWRWPEVQCLDVAKQLPVACVLEHRQHLHNGHRPLCASGSPSWCQMLT